MPKTRQDGLPEESMHLLRHDHRTVAHTHSCGHLVYPATGVLSLVTVRGSWIAPSNRVVWIPGGFEHQHRAHGETDMRIVFMSDDLARMLSPYPVVLSITPLARETILRLTNNDGLSAAARDRLRMVAIDELAAASEQPLHLPETNDARIRAVTRLVEKELSNPLTLSELGLRVAVSERTLSRLFRTETGMSFLQWRTQLRIHYALLWLSEGRSVINTASACGWSNPSVFIDAFTTLVGQTPGRYQRSLVG